jgi:hypothetical protein
MAWKLSLQFYESKIEMGDYGFSMTNFTAPGPGLGFYGQVLANQYQAAPANYHYALARGAEGAAGAATGLALAARNTGRPKSILRRAVEIGGPLIVQGVGRAVSRSIGNGLHSGYQYLTAPSPFRNRMNLDVETFGRRAEAAARRATFKNQATLRQPRYNAPAANAGNESENQLVPTRNFNESRWKNPRPRPNGRSTSTLKSPPQLPQSDPRYNNASGAQRWISKNGRRIINHDPTNLSHMRNWPRESIENSLRRADSLHKELVPEVAAAAAPHVMQGTAASLLSPPRPMNGTAASLLMPQPRPEGLGLGFLPRVLGAATTAMLGSQPQAPISRSFSSALPPPRGGKTRRTKKTKKSRARRHK